MGPWGRYFLSLTLCLAWWWRLCLTLEHLRVPWIKSTVWVLDHLRGNQTVKMEIKSHLLRDGGCIRGRTCMWWLGGFMTLSHYYAAWPSKSKAPMSQMRSPKWGPPQTRLRTDRRRTSCGLCREARSEKGGAEKTRPQFIHQRIRPTPQV